MRASNRIVDKLGFLDLPCSGGSLEDNVEERGRNSREMLIQFGDGQKVNNPKQVEEHGKVQCQKEKKDDDTLNDNQTTTNTEGTACAHQNSIDSCAPIDPGSNAIPPGNDNKQANQSVVTDFGAVSAPPPNNGYYLNNKGDNKATENTNNPNEEGTVDDNLTATSEAQKTACEDEPPKADQPSNGKTKANQDASITVIFHALLTPTFNANFNQGDKVFLRGDPPLSWNSGTGQIEMRPLRYLNLIKLFSEPYCTSFFCSFLCSLCMSFFSYAGTELAEDDSHHQQLW